MNSTRQSWNGMETVHVMQLLIKDSSLMQHWPERVLHLGARRGCADLVEQVIKFCDGEEMLRDKLEKDRQRVGVSRKEEIRSSSSSKAAFRTTLALDQPDENRTPTDNGSSKNGDPDSHSPDVALAGTADKDKFSGATVDLNERLVQVEDDRQAVKILTEEIKSSSSSIKGVTTLAPDHPDEIQPLADDSSSENDVGSSHSQDAALECRPADKDDFGRALDDLNEQLAVTGKADQRHERVKLDDLLRWKSPHYSNLDADAVALLNGNLDVLSLVSSKRRRYDSQIESRHREKLRTIAERVYASIKEDSAAHQSCQSIFNAMSSNRDFNFLFWDFHRGEERVSEYLFHFLCTREVEENSRKEARLIRECLWSEVRNSSTKKDPLWKSLLKLHDAQGRTPLHVAVDEGTVYNFSDEFGSDAERDARDFAVGAPDGLGRTVWHRAVSLGNWLILFHLKRYLGLNKLWDDTMKGVVAFSTEEGIDWNTFILGRISERNGFQAESRRNGATALQSALIHGKTRELGIVLPGIFPRDTLFHCKMRGQLWSLDTLELATLTGNAHAVRRLLDEMSKSKLTQKYGWLVGEKRVRDPRILYPTIHLAASSGNYEVLKAFLELSNKLCDPFIEDWQKRTVLHHAMKVEDLRYKPHLLDYVNMKHLESNDP